MALALLGFDIGIAAVVVVAVAVALEPLTCCSLVVVAALPVVGEPLDPSWGSSLKWNSSVAFASAGDLVAWKLINKWSIMVKDVEKCIPRVNLVFI